MTRRWANLDFWNPNHMDKRREGSFRWRIRRQADEIKVLCQKNLWMCEKTWEPAGTYSVCGPWNKHLFSRLTNTLWPTFKRITPAKRYDSSARPLQTDRDFRLLDEKDGRTTEPHRLCLQQPPVKSVPTSSTKTLWLERFYSIVIILS